MTDISKYFPTQCSVFIFILCKVRDSLYLREDMRGQLKDASSVTFKAYSAFRRELDPDLELMGSGLEGSEEVVEETQMSQAITIMKPILRFLQLLCENHNRDLQVLCDSSCLKFCLGYRLCVSARCVNGNVSQCLQRYVSYYKKKAP